MRRPSLRQRLLWFIGLPVIVLWLVAGGWLGHRIAHETGEMFDRELERTAASVLAMADTNFRIVSPPAPVGATPGKKDHGDESSRAEIVLRDRSGRVLLNASTLPPLPTDGHTPVFRTLSYAGRSWRVYQRWGTDRAYWVQLAAPLHDRDQLRTAHVEATLIPVAMLLFLLPITIWLGLKMGLAPLRAVSRAIEARPERTPILTQGGVPTELVRLTRALDSLTTRLDAALTRERRFTADAAHELRHPLSVLRMELDLASTTVDGTIRAGHLERARSGLARMERLVDQLLTLARVENLDCVEDANVLDAGTLAREVLAEASERAAPRGVELGLHADEGARVRGSAGLLAIALRNLVDNAILHGRSDGHVDLDVVCDAGHVEFAVSDDGAGLSEAQAARLGERFVRGGNGGGSGLGLSIARAITQLHGGDIKIGRSPAGGARIVLSLAAADATGPPPS